MIMKGFSPCAESMSSPGSPDKTLLFSPVFFHHHFFMDTFQQTSSEPPSSKQINIKCAALSK